MAEIDLKLSTSESRFSDYYAYLKDLAKTLDEDSVKYEEYQNKNGGFIANKGVIHASILMGTLLSNTQNTLKMYCNGLSPNLLCGNVEGPEEEQTAYWKVFKSFFTEKVKKISKGLNVGGNCPKPIQILVRTDKWMGNLPFKIVGQACHDYPDTVVVKMESNKSQRCLREFWGKNENINFSIYDNRAFRLEYSPKNYKALASFRNEKWSDALTNVFDGMFSVATPLQFDANGVRVS